MKTERLPESVRRAWFDGTSDAVVHRRSPPPAGARAPDPALALARCGDAAALTALWETHRRWVAVVLLAHKPAEIDLDDLLQDVAVTLVTRLDDLREEAGFRGWLRMVAINAARAAARSLALRRTERLPEADREPVAGGPLGGGGPDGGAEAQRLMELAGSLPAEYREPLLLKSLREMSYRQIATLLDLPETTVETRITRGRRMLRERAAAAALAPIGAQ